MNPQTTERITQLVASGSSGAEVLAVTECGPSMLRVTVDHPDGVSLAVCEQVTADLDELRERFGLEVSSPGPERPLLRPEHFVRYAGRRASLRLVDGAAAGPKVVGEIVEADESSVVLNADGERLTLPYDLIDRANLTAA